ncbi:alpha-1,2-fucosyltransferase [Parabacteroides sp.]
MIHLVFEGGLGNQLFQYAFGRYCQRIFEEKVKYNTSKYTFEACEEREFELHSFNINKEWEIEPLHKSRLKRFGLGYILYLLISKPYIEINKRRQHKGLSSIFDAVYQQYINWIGFYRIHYGDLIKPKRSWTKDKYIRGQWIWISFVQELGESIKDELQVITPISDSNMSFLNKIRATNSVGVHIRRGDYVSLGLIVCSIRYYEYCIREMMKMTEASVFYIFSDDIPWVRENLHVDANIVFVDNNNPAPEDLRLLYSCNHFILSNSTFSWWGAYLGRAKEKIVMVPKHWNVNDLTIVSRLILPEWIAMDNSQFLEK